MRLKQSTVLCLRARPLATRPVEIMPKGKGKGGRRGGETKAERARQRALARELSAIKAVAECCDGFRDEYARGFLAFPGRIRTRGGPFRVLSGT